AVLEKLAEQLAQAVQLAEQTRKGATHEEAKPENDKDTRALEQSYLARGQAIRVEELRGSLAQAQTMPIKPFPEGSRVSLGALVTADEDGEELVFLLAPARGGTKLDGGVQVVTPSSPLGRALLGK